MTTRMGLGAFIVFCGIALAAGAGRAETPLERGAYLVNSVGQCANCHTPREGALAGAELAGGRKFGGDQYDAWSRNLTPDPETGLGKWTDEQIIVALRDGKRPDGTYVGPPMPIEMYRRMSDSDARAIVAYLRSIKPVSNPLPKSDYKKAWTPGPWGPPTGSVPDVPRTDKVRYGGYIFTALGHCAECHTPELNGHRDYENRMGAGGIPFGGPQGIRLSANLTPDPETGLGKWSDDDIKKAVTQGVRPDGSRLYPVMAVAFFAKMTPEDLDAVVAFLRSLKPINQAVR